MRRFAGDREFLSRPIGPLFMLLGDMIMLAGACLWMLLMTIADPAIGFVIWFGILVLRSTTPRELAG